MKTNVAQSLLVIALALGATALATTSQAADSGAIKVQVAEQTYKFDSYTSSTGKSYPEQNIKIQVQYAQPQTAVELEKAKEWLRVAEDKYGVQSRYVVNFGKQNISLSQPELLLDKKYEVVTVPLNRLQKIRNWLASKTGIIKPTEETQVDISTPAKRSKIRENIDNFIYKFSNDKINVPLPNGKSFNLKYQPTLAVVRGTVNGTVISLSFLASDLPPGAAIGIGYLLGASSGFIQYIIDPFSSWLAREGYTHALYKKAAAKYIYLSSFYSAYRAGISAELAKETAAAAEEEFMKLKFTESALKNASLITKWWAVEVLILGAADLLFRAAGAPLTPDLTSGIASVLTTSTLATLGQGTWDFAFIIDNEKRKEALTDRREALIAADQLTTEASEEIDRGFSKVKFTLAIKAFAISVSSNIAAALLLADNPSMTSIASTTMSSLSLAGAGYYGYIQLKYNEGLRAKIAAVKSAVTSKIQQSCESLLVGAWPHHN